MADVRTTDPVIEHESRKADFPVTDKSEFARTVVPTEIEPLVSVFPYVRKFSPIRALPAHENVPPILPVPAAETDPAIWTLLPMLMIFETTDGPPTDNRVPTVTVSPTLSPPYRSEHLLTLQVPAI
jgi:hypothetical protein